MEKMIMEITQAFEDSKMKKKSKLEQIEKQPQNLPTPTPNRIEQFYINIPLNHELIEEYLG
jgi:hypothetical protein